MSTSYNLNSVSFQDPVMIPAAQLAPVLITASTALAAFDLFDAKDMTVVRLIHEHLVTALTGSNNDLSFIARAAGDQSVTITYAVAGNDTPLTVSVVGQAITVNVATDGSGNATSTAADVLAAVQASVTANALVIVALASGNDGTGVVTALSSTPLVASVGSSPTLDVKTECSMDGGANYYESVAFTQATSTATIEAKKLAVTGKTARHVVTLGGTGSPRFALSIQAIYRP